MRAPWTWIRETWNFDVSRGAWWGGFGALRSFFNSSLFFRQPQMEGTTVNYDLARSLYRNDNDKHLYGAGFVRPIIDLTVEYVGLPTVSSESGDNDAFLNECIRDFWAPALQQMIRDSCRDSKVIVRFYQPRIDNPLFTSSDRDHGCVEIIPPEQVDLIFDPVDKNFLLQATITHFYGLDDRTQDEIANGVPPRTTQHQIIETITPTLYSYIDKTTGTTLDSWSVINSYGFVPVWPVWNEYAADLGGGQSDIEPVLPFIKAFHDVLQQTLAAHKYHSIPKAKFNVKDVQTFISNNWPGVIDSSTGRLISGAKIDWKGDEIIFFGPDEDGGFIEAKSVLGDSKTLLDFLVECISIASETPRWALLSDDAARTDSAQLTVFTKKIERKRINFNEAFVMICKMALAANGKVPETPRLTWPLVNVFDLVSKGQAIQQLIMAFDVATSHEWMADSTVMKILAATFPEMNAIDVEKSLAADNVVAVPAPAPASPTQALPPASKNGSGSTTAAKAALATTAASKS